MLYIAEVKLQSKGFRSNKMALKLLAGQRPDQTWTAVPGEELIPLEETALVEGALVTVKLGNNRQMQGQPQPAGSKVVGWLQELTRLLERTRSQDEEIEQWKESLTYQAQELSRRQEEMDATWEELSLREEDIAALEEKRQEIARQRAAQIERLETAIAKFEQAPETPLGELAQQVGELTQKVQQEQAHLENQIEQGKQRGIDPQRLQSLRQDANEGQTTLEEARRKLAVQEKALDSKVEAVARLTRELEVHGHLQNEIVNLAAKSDVVTIGQPVDLDALGRMPLRELEAAVDSLRRDYEKVVPFVNDQEEELNLQRQSVEELEERLKATHADERESLQKELEEERDRYRYLEETLVGQRRNLKVRENILVQHRRVLRRRKGEAWEDEEPEKVDLGPILQQIEAQKARTEEEIAQQENEKSQLQTIVSQARELLELQQGKFEAKLQQMQQIETILVSLGGMAPLQQQQERLQQVKQQLEAIAQPLQQVAELGSDRAATLENLRSMLSELQAMAVADTVEAPAADDDGSAATDPEEGIEDSSSQAEAD